MFVFATETSCDDTSICLMDNKKIIEHITFSQKIHTKHGGIVPELASRAHLENLQEIMKILSKNPSFDLKNVDVFAATCGPGLIGSLLVGSTFTKSLSINNSKPFIPINHLEGHVLSTSFNNIIEYPHLVLLLTGGHTQIYLMKDNVQIELIGETVDDAIGEAFDKTAKILGLSYPGGFEIERSAIDGDENLFEIPKPMYNEKTSNFSFSGIKTHVNLLAKKNKLDKIFIQNVSASFQKTIVEILVNRLDYVIELMQKKKCEIKSISVVGGVSNNKYIKNKLEKYFKTNAIKIYYPIKEMMSDNAAMIAWACIKNYSESNKNIFFKPNPRMKIGETYNQVRK